MGLTSRAFTIFCVVAAIAAPAATMLLWARVKGPRCSAASSGSA